MTSILDQERTYPGLDNESGGSKSENEPHQPDASRLFDEHGNPILEPLTREDEGADGLAGREFGAQLEKINRAPVPEDPDRLRETIEAEEDRLRSSAKELLAHIPRLDEIGERDDLDAGDKSNALRGFQQKYDAVKGKIQEIALKGGISLTALSFPFLPGGDYYPSNIATIEEALSWAIGATGAVGSLWTLGEVGAALSRRRAKNKAV